MCKGGPACCESTTVRAATAAKASVRSIHEASLQRSHSCAHAFISTVVDLTALFMLILSVSFQFLTDVAEVTFRSYVYKLHSKHRHHDTTPDAQLNMTAHSL